MNTLIYFLFGYLVVQTICLIWFYSPLRTSIGQLFISSEIYTNEEVETWLLLKSPLFGKLLSCYICFSFWTSLFAGVAAWLIFGFGVHAPIITSLSYPSICYLYKATVDKSS